MAASCGEIDRQLYRHQECICRCLESVWLQLLMLWPSIITPIMASFFAIIPRSIFPLASLTSGRESTQSPLEPIISASPITALAIGIGLTVAGSCLMALGSVVMKTGIHKESKRLQRDVPVPLTSYLWWLG